MHPLFIVDVFAEEKYAGNQLAVVLEAADLATNDMQRIAREMNFSETTFVLAHTPRAGAYDVRIFTPTSELPFAGHPTLGTAFVILTQGQSHAADAVTLNVPIGRVPVRRDADGQRLWMSPRPPELGATHDTALIAELLGLSRQDLDARFPVQTLSIGIPFTFVPIRTLAAIKHARFNAAAAERITAPAFPLQFFLFTAETYSEKNQINARMFAGELGVPEDPATGSANTCLGTYLTHHRYFGTDSVDVRVEQGYEIGRPSLLYVRATYAPDGVRVEVGGQVFMVVRGELV